jgi:hypothetical protein
MKLKFLLFLTAFILLRQLSGAQGCVAIRSNGATCTMTGNDAAHSGNEQKFWTFAVNNRYFKSFRHFVGTEEQKQRVEEGTEVINRVFSTEFGLTRQFNNRWSFAFFIPVISNGRSSLYEHRDPVTRTSVGRFSTHSFGLGDVRFAAYYWLVNSAKSKKGNVQLGLGVKLPTGDYKYQDYFHISDTSTRLGPVDQSIQLGDGGTGLTLETNAYYNISKRTSLFFNGFYLSNPREQNGVSTARGGAPGATDVKYKKDVMSVPDQYMVRLGASYAVNSFSFSGGLRMECVPSEDLIGTSNGFRRPGYVLSAEPVMAYKLKQAQLYISVPNAVQRNRTQSVPDKIQTRLTGLYTKGDAAFADYSINFGVAFSLK